MLNLRRDTEINNNVKGVNEIFKTFKSSDIKQYCLGEKDESKLYANIKTSLNKTSKKEVNICFTQLECMKFPNEEGINFITNLSYINSDITPLPLIHFLFNKNALVDDFNLFLEFMKSCIESINRLNNKAILGLIPSGLPSPFIKHLVEFYHNHNVTSYAFDFQGRVHTNFSSNIRELVNNVLKLDLYNESFLYACNTPKGNVIQGKKCY